MYRYALRQERIVLKYERAAFLIPCQGLRGFDSISSLTFQLISRHSRFGRLPIPPDSSILKSNIKTIKWGLVKHMDKAKMGTFIKEQRMALGMTQQQLAEQLHITNKAISRWETGDSLR